MRSTSSRRQMLGNAALAGSGAVLSALAPAAAQTVPATSVPGGETMNPVEFNRDRNALHMQPQPPGQPGRDYTPAITPNGVTLPFKIVGGVKVMHLIAQPLEHEFAPGLTAHCWGYNGRTPGPTIEAVEGDAVRIYVTNRLPAPTTIHWHGLRIPNGMDGVSGLTQPPIPPGQTFRYEFICPLPGTFMYHPHLDEMTQQGMGLMGMFIVHPRVRPADAIDRDFVMMLSEWRIDPGTRTPVVNEMTDFNVFTINSKVYPATDPLPAAIGQRVRLRFGNLSSMDHHPLHLHGHQMTLVETDGGPVPLTARTSFNTILVPVGSTRAVDFIADNPGDWPLHCHMSHHMMNQMGHARPPLIGVDASALDNALQPLLPHYMTMGESGMADMMPMPTPPNSIPMLGGKGPYGDIDMGGMFTILQVRPKLNPDGSAGPYVSPPADLASPATAEELRRDGIDPDAKDAKP